MFSRATCVTRRTFYSGASKSVTLADLSLKSRSNKKISMLTAYDFPSARVIDEAGSIAFLLFDCIGIDLTLVGDSVANVVLGHAFTGNVSVREMAYHIEAVARGTQRYVPVFPLLLNVDR